MSTRALTAPDRKLRMMETQAAPELDNDNAPLAGQTPLQTHFEAALANARPRLLRFARAQGIAADAADDVVQETLLEAWRHLDRLQTPQGADAWLTRICQHVCLRWRRTQGMTSARQTSLSPTDHTENPAQDQPEIDIADPLVFDPAEELNRQDLVILLDRALGYLPPHTREAVELCHLAEMPQREAARRLGVTINTLEVRLHRAHRQLRQVLSGALRAEAEAFGLAFDQDESIGWHETRMWCNLCGRFHLRGFFERSPNGRVRIRLRCPHCSARYGDMFNSGIASLDGVRTFRPAFKRVWKADAAYWAQGLAAGRQYCVNCKTQLVPLQIGRPAELTTFLAFPDVYRIILDCPRCGVTGTCSVVAVLEHPHITRFTDEHPRWIIGPEQPIEYEGQPALLTSLLDPTDNARLTVVANRRTLQTLGAFYD